MDCNIHCPRCGSGDYRSNAVQPFSEERYVQAAQASRAARLRGLEAVIMAGWAVNRAANALRHPYRCNVCNLAYSAPQEGLGRD